MARGLGSTGKHHVRVPPADRLPGLADGVTPGGTGGDDAEVGALRTKGDGDHTGGKVGDGHRDQEWRHPVRALLAHQENLVGQCPDAADAGADDDAGPFGQLAFQAGGQSGLIHGLARCHQSELDVAVVAALVLAVEDRRGIEALDLAGDSHRQPRRIELRDGADAGATGDQSRPGRLSVEPERCDRTHPGDYYPRLAVDRTHRTNSRATGSFAAIALRVACGNAVSTFALLIEPISLYGWWRRDTRRRAGRGPKRHPRLP